jgi:hypothetical protein
MHLLRTRAAPVALALGTGVLLGLVGPGAEKLDNTFYIAIGTIFSAGWSWACYGFLMGYFCRSKVESALLSSLGLTVGVVTYYIFKDMNPHIPQGVEPATVSTGIRPDASEGTSSQILVWGTAALIFGIPVGLLGNLARIPGIRGLGFRLVVPFVAFYETSMRISVEADSQAPIVEMTWSLIRLTAGAVALALVSHTIWSWWNTRRTHTHSGSGVRT